ncbi:LysR family transcriptional regulator, partial [Salmonella enterica subsp. enterica serovar Newport]|nr:LysR family transcriptional regulator [Salmonella enterica subsp. enterica serovar Newport]
MQYRKRLPSLTGLLALEATVRLRSVTMAAKELGVTQAAVSRQIAQLEEEFGRPLFYRGHRTIEPTPSCLALGNALGESFADMAQSVEAMRGDRAEVVTI